ncbi:hypothetical protein IQ249_02310 [Lusitaniella coriacea LEGE 07157]|uniref:Uncharacterized protein n=1 Tax=Lusitaniella coriacea LEGE 07157 TaxID=945747 RepID=A0A8J7B6X9_9CYAN|nr:hypothetical protein [Lusitaniella coriacea]MBE9114721.1 hypothetical protein [Lusitaniella coriacea LEGE 07157]
MKYFDAIAREYLVSGAIPFCRRAKFIPNGNHYRSTMSRPYCNCFEAQYSGSKWSKTKLHTEQQDTECDAWKRLLELVEIAAADKRKVFVPSLDFTSGSDRCFTTFGQCLLARLY